LAKSLRWSWTNQLFSIGWRDRLSSSAFRSAGKTSKVSVFIINLLGGFPTAAYALAAFLVYYSLRSLNQKRFPPTSGKTIASGDAGTQIVARVSTLKKSMNDSSVESKRLTSSSSDSRLMKRLTGFGRLWV